MSFFLFAEMGPKRTRPGAASSSHPAYALHFRNEGHTRRFHWLSTYAFLPTYYLSEDVLQPYRLWEDISTYLANIGWEGVQGVRFPTYREPVLEILSNITYYELDQDDDHPEELPGGPRVHFQLGGEMRDISLAEFNIYCHFETAESIQALPI